MSKCHPHSDSSLPLPRKDVNPHPLLIFDNCVVGFGIRYKHRFELLGYSIVLLKRGKADFYIKELAKKYNAIIVTRDKDFKDYQKAIILSKIKYEEMWSEFWRKLKYNNVILNPS